MLKLIIRQANLGILCLIFALIIIFFVKIYINDIVCVTNYSLYNLDFILIPALVYLLYFLIFIKQIKEVVKAVK